MLVARWARALILEELDGVVAACARLAEDHRGTPMAGRTLLQQALPTTFGLKAAGWLSGVAAARATLAEVELAAQLGGGAGTLAGLGPAVLARFAARLELAEPALPWHGDRTRVAALGAALAIAAGACEKVAFDIVLLAQNEVGEVAEASEGGRGGSSAMAHKRNPVGAVRARAAARAARGATGVLLEAMAGEHERAAGAWQSEWGALTTALAATGGAAWSLREGLEGLSVNAERMAANLEGLPGEFDMTTVNTLIDRALERAR
jgi:3-carboxy-cis,cis-muconate cycloisomerase